MPLILPVGVRQPATNQPDTTTAYSLSGTPDDGHLTLQSQAADGDYVPYTAQQVDANGNPVASGKFESGVGLFTATGATLSRAADGYRESSEGSDAAVDWGAAAVTPRIFTSNNREMMRTAHLPDLPIIVTSGNAADVAWGRNHLMTISGATATIAFEVPAPPFVGARMRIQLATNASSTAGRELVLKGATGIDVGGAGAATEYTALHSIREYLVLRARSLTVVDVDIDGRTEAIGTMSLSSTQTDNDDGVQTNVPYQTTLGTLRGFVFTAGSVSTANPPTPVAGSLTVRRSGSFDIALEQRPGNANLTDGASYQVRVLAPTTGAVVVLAPLIRASTSITNNYSVDGKRSGVQLTRGNVITVQFQGGLDVGALASSAVSSLSVREVLRR